MAVQHAPPALVPGLLLVCLSGCPLGGDGGGGADLVCDAGTGTRADCPEDPNVHNLTGLEALQALKQSFQSQFPGALWMGGLAGLYIGRDGRSRDAGPVIEVGGFRIENASGWTGNFCVGQPSAETDDQLNFETSSGACTALRTCLVVHCNAVQPMDFPQVDTPAAIQAAFPEDPADTLYSVQLVMAFGNYWQITRAAIDHQVAETKKVDGQTGQVLPRRDVVETRRRTRPGAPDAASEALLVPDFGNPDVPSPAFRAVPETGLPVFPA